jgi:hypothetical protein
VQHSTAFRAHVHIDLYLGEGLKAWERVRHYAAAYRRSQMLRVQMLRIELFELRGRSALAAAATAARPDPLLRAAAREARRLDREREPWSRAHARLLRAAIAALRGDRTRATAELSTAVGEFEAVEMELYAAAARRRLGEMIGGAQGKALIEAADRWMQQQTIRDPARMTAVFAPGFPGSAGSSEEYKTLIVS